MYAVLAVGLAALSLEPPHSTPLWPMVLLGIGGLAALTIRHRYPRLSFGAAVTLSVLSLACGSGAESLLAVVAVYSAGARHKGRIAWLSFGIAMASAAIGAVALSMRGTVGPPILGLAPRILGRDPLLDWANVFLIIAAVLLIVALLGTNAGHRRRYIGELVVRAERLARERDQQVEIARALERERIAREMHDVIAHSLSVIIAVSDGAHAAADDRPAEAKAAIARVAETGRRALGEVRRLLGSVRDDGGSAQEHEPQPDASRLATLAGEFVAAGLPVRLTVAGTPSTDPGLGLTVYRIVQESLTNVLRHARQVRAVTVTVAWTADDVTIHVRDDGPPIAAGTEEGRGLLGIRERVALYGGTVDAGPDVEGGWRVLARLRSGDPQS
ncbi:histidine kinase [Conyzicola nivalis]|uniref:histidine kinase n=1 Tax=Conyzicola nivalis TaxID=1477021 RepID=A0A916SSF9_9MICO|nr:two-component sensor histidine kinase [Conyzicola nivalis]